MITLAHFAVPNSVWNWIHGLGGPGLILLGLSDNTPFVSAPPGSVDVCVILLAAHRPEWWAYYAFMTMVGEVLGGYLTYRLSRKGGKQALEKKVSRQRAEMVYRGFEKFGSVTLGDHLKTGHTLSVQNRPTGLAEDVIVLPCRSVFGQGVV